MIEFQKLCFLSTCIIFIKFISVQRGAISYNSPELPLQVLCRRFAVSSNCAWTISCQGPLTCRIQTNLILSVCYAVSAMNGTFYEQLSGVAGVFEQWGPCERTVVACALARRVPWPGLKLVQRAVEAALQNHVDDELLEHEANDESMLANFLTTRAEDDDNEVAEQVRRLMQLLPLLRTDNERAKDIYVTAAQTLVQRCVDSPRQLLTAPDLCRQLLSYLLVHPALTNNDQKTLTQWLRHLENHISGNLNTESVWQQRIDPCLLSESNIWGVNNTFRRTIGKNVEFRGILDPTETFYTDLLQESFSKNGRDVDISLEGEKLDFDAVVAQPKSQRSNSLTPPSTNIIHMSSSAENLSDEPFVQKPRSFSLSSEHSLSQLRPISIMYGTTGSETRLDDLRSQNFGEHPGMSTVTQWLKSLRLHKYVWLFSNISYDQMISMDDAYLEKLGVTKGARHKLLLSIEKLSERSSIVEAVEAELTACVSAATCARALERLRTVLLSPMPPTSELPAQIIRALNIASDALDNGCGPSTRVPAPHVSLDDGEHEPPVDPLSLHCWLVEKALHHEAFNRPELLEQLMRMRHRLPPRQFFHHVSDMPLNRRCTKPRWRMGVGYQKLPRRSWAAGGAVGPAVPRGKSHSYPPFPPAQRPPPPPSAAPSLDYSSLDALCLQMTEQAIN